MDPLFCLHWNDHQNTLVSVLEKMLVNEQMTDVTLTAEGQLIGAHKVILSACSQYFEQVFSACGDKHPVVFLKDVRFEDLKCLLNYMYKGEVNVSQDQLPALIKTAESLKVKGLADGGEKKRKYEDSEILPSEYGPSKSKNVSESCPPSSSRKQQKTKPHDSEMLSSIQQTNLRKYHSPSETSAHETSELQNLESDLKSEDKDINLVETASIKQEYLETDDTSADFISAEGLECDSDAQGPENANDQSNPGCDVNWSFIQEINSIHTMSGMSSNQDTHSPLILEDGVSDKFVCPKCSRVYKFKRNLYRHVKDECGVESQHQCFLCSKRFRRKDYLRAHMSAHGVDIVSNENAGLYSCPNGLNKSVNVFCKDPD